MPLASSDPNVPLLCCWCPTPPFRRRLQSVEGCRTLPGFTPPRVPTRSSATALAASELATRVVPYSIRRGAAHPLRYKASSTRARKSARRLRISSSSPRHLLVLAWSPLVGLSLPEGPYPSPPSTTKNTHQNCRLSDFSLEILLPTGSRKLSQARQLGGLEKPKWATQCPPWTTRRPFGGSTAAQPKKLVNFQRVNREATGLFAPSDDSNSYSLARNASI